MLTYAPSLKKLMDATYRLDEQSGKTSELYKAAWKFAVSKGWEHADVEEAAQKDDLGSDDVILEALTAAVRYNNRGSLLVLADNPKVQYFIRNTKDMPLLLHFAAEHSSADVVDILLDLNFDVSLRNANGRTPLLLCADNSLKDMLRLLLDKGADPNACDDMGDTIWHLAAANDAVLILEFLFATVDRVDHAMRVVNHDMRTPLARSLLLR